LLHYAVFEDKAAFIHQALHLYENEVNVKNAMGNTPFHYACLKGNIEIVLILFHMRRAQKPLQPIRAAPVDLLITNKAGLLPIQLAIARSHFFVVHFLLCQETVVTNLADDDFDIYQCLKIAISARAS
jgi:ankyrin repeat protein